MSPDNIRTAYLSYFAKQGHVVLPSASLVPENDPTTLFTGSGMQPLVPYLLGALHPEGTRLTDSQKSFRSGDIEEVGDNRHTTFFEMLGNWSLGDYGKKEQLRWFFTFLTEEVGLDPKRIFVTAFAGDETLGIPRDEEAEQIWKTLFAEKNIEAQSAHLGSEEEGAERGMQEGERIFFYNAKKNWWSRSGVPSAMPAGEPGGPDSEVFYDFGTPHDPAFGAHCHPNCDCGRFLEIGNSVFMQYKKEADGSFVLLPKMNIDFGGGLERIAMASANTPDIVQINHAPIITFLESTTGKKYGADAKNTKAFRVIADHLKASVFLIGDGVMPSNTERGYFVRRLLRRAVRFADVLGVKEQGLSRVVAPIIAMYAEAYPTLVQNKVHIEKAVAEEEEKFRKTLAHGLKEFEKITSKEVSGADAFLLFSTYGFPLEITQELAEERGKAVNLAGFAEEMKKHQDISRAGSEQKFKGGLGDHSDMSVKYHTATHLLHKALREVLGDHVAQKGSNITPERLRFDFSHPNKMTDEEKQKVEDMVNAQIQADLPVACTDLPLAEAKKSGAIGLFEEKYGDTVRVYTIGEFSKELCGGPHVTHTGELGVFHIQKEEACSAGVRRIKAVLE